MKKYWALLMTACLLLCSACASEEGMDSYDEATYILTHSVDTKMYLFGDDIEFRENVPCKKITSLDPAEMQEGKDINVLIINNLSGTVSFTQEEIDRIAPYVLDGRLNYYYLGTDHIDMFYNAGLWDTDKRDGDQLCITMSWYDPGAVMATGIWSEYDVEMMKKSGDDEAMAACIMAQIRSAAEDCYGWYQED